MTAFCFLLAFCLAAPSSYRVDRGRHLASSTFAGVAQCRALSPDFPAGARGLYPLARGCRIRPARGMAPALMVCWIAGGAGFFLFSLPPAYADPRGMKHKPDQVFEHRGGVLFLVSVLLGGAVELPGRSRPAPGVVDIRWVAIWINQVQRDVAAQLNEKLPPDRHDSSDDSWGRLPS